MPADRSSYSFRPLEAGRLTVGARPKRPATSTRVVEVAIICGGGVGQILLVQATGTYQVLGRTDEISTGHHAGARSLRAGHSHLGGASLVQQQIC